MSLKHFKDFFLKTNILVVSKKYSERNSFSSGVVLFIKTRYIFLLGIVVLIILLSL